MSTKSDQNSNSVCTKATKEVCFNFGLHRRKIYASSKVSLKNQKVIWSSKCYQGCTVFQCMYVDN